MPGSHGRKAAGNCSSGRRTGGGPARAPEDCCGSNGGGQASHPGLASPRRALLPAWTPGNGEAPSRNLHGTETWASLVFRTPTSGEDAAHRLTPAFRSPAHSVPGNGRAGAPAKHAGSCSSGSRVGGARRHVAPSAAGGGPGGCGRIWCCLVSLCRAFLPAMYCWERLTPAEESAWHCYASFPAHPYSCGTDGTGAWWGHGVEA